MHSRRLLLNAVVASVCCSGYAAAQAQVFAQPEAQIIKSVDESASVTLTGNVHPLAASANVSQSADFGTPMQHMILYLTGNATQEAQLTQLIAAQHDPKSALYHQFLTPQTFGTQFGAAQADITKVTAWLQGHGFAVEQVPAGNRAIVFSGTSAQVEDAFKTEIRQYTVAGASHYANASNPQIPAALTGAVGGVVKLNDFRHAANLAAAKPLTAAQVANPQYSGNSGGHYLAPSDYGILYDINPLYTAGVNGAGETIAVLARSNIYMSDVQSFRNFAGLPANNPQIIITNSDPGVLQGDSVETTLDTEWSGAVAPKATVKVIVSASTNSSDGIDLSALYAVNNNVAPIISLSYGSCEAWMGSSGLAYYNSLWKQAAAQGQSVMVSAGDSGAAGCDSGGESKGAYGRAINGLCSSPYATCVGGTQFADTPNPGQYWLPGNNSTNGSAISYIPEAIWNESGANGASGLWSGGGGASITYPKPSWQSGPGVPADGKRDVPDISLTAASHDGYLIWLYGGLNSVGGTSASAPSFAGLMALVDQKVGTRQGLVNTVLYPLAATQSAGGAKVFHDITAGNNTVPGVTGYPATAGYDLASGIGTVDANLLVNHWTDLAAAATLSLSASTTSVTVVEGGSGQITLTSTASASLKSAVTLTETGAPTGVTATLASTTIASPGSGSVVLKVAATAYAIPGTYSLTIAGTGGGQTAQVVISVVIPTPTFTLSTSVTLVNGGAAGTAPFTVSTTPQNGFSTAVSLSLAGMPAGVTAAFSTTTVAAAGGSSVVSLTVASSAKAGSYPLTITAKGGTVTQTSSITLVVSVTGSCTLAVNPTGLTLSAGSNPASVQVSCGSAQGTFSGPLALSVSGAPAGMTAQFGASTLTPGSVTVLNVGSALTTAGGSYSLSVTASGSGFNKTVTLPVTVVSVNSFSIMAGPNALTVKPGANGQLMVTSALINKYNGTVSLGVTGLPAGVTAAWSNATLGAPGSGSSMLTLMVAASAKAGTYSFTVTGTGSGIVQTAPVTLTVGTMANFSFSINLSAITIPQGGQGTVIVSTGNYTGGFNGQITMSYSGLAAGMSWGIPSGSAANNMVNISVPFTASASTPIGVYALTITDTGNGGIVHSGTVMVTVTAAATQTKH